MTPKKDLASPIWSTVRSGCCEAPAENSASTDCMASIKSGIETTDRTSASESKSGTSQLTDSVGVNLGNRVDVRTVAAAHTPGNRNSGAPIDHDPVACAQPLDGQLQAPQPIAFEWIGAGEVEHEIGSLPFERF